MYLIGIDGLIILLLTMSIKHFNKEDGPWPLANSFSVFPQ